VAIVVIAFGYAIARSSNLVMLTYGLHDLLA
jgi:hypothetical protein